MLLVSYLVALTEAIKRMEESPDLAFWLRDYRVKQVKIKREVKVLERQEKYQLPRASVVYSGYRELSGGVQLMAIALRLRAGSVTALEEAALKTRYNPKVWKKGTGGVSSRVTKPTRGYPGMRRRHRHGAAEHTNPGTVKLYLGGIGRLCPGARATIHPRAIGGRSDGVTGAAEVEAANRGRRPGRLS
jgi:hypothetical protein